MLIRHPNHKADVHRYIRNEETDLDLLYSDDSYHYSTDHRNENGVYMLLGNRADKRSRSSIRGMSHGNVYPCQDGIHLDLGTETDGS